MEYNGRIDIMSNGGTSGTSAASGGARANGGRGYSTYRTCDNPNSSDGYDIVSGNLSETPVSALYFSKTNMDALQRGICNRVFNQSEGKYSIGKQSEAELKIIMRSFYLESLRGGVPLFQDGVQPLNNSDNSTVARVRKLNEKVLDWSVPRIINNIKQFERYKSDVSKMPNVMDRPSFVSSAGSKSLEYQSYF
jgi:hypothetical protein